MAAHAAVAADLEPILGLWANAGNPHAAGVDADALRALIEAGETVWVVEHEDAIVGTLIAAWDGWRGNMYRLTVAESHRRRGTAQELVAAGEAALRARGARRITALVPRENPAAAGLWRAVGYTHDAAWARYVKNLG